MDKLKQVLKYQFWILLVVALIVPVVGWVMARSGLIQEAEARTKVLDGLSTNLKAGPEDPNGDWQRGVAEINKVQQDQVRQAWVTLYAQQQKRMTWPPKIDPDKFDSAVDQGEQLELYRVSYAPALEKVRQIVKPVDDDGLNGFVELSDGLLPHPEDEWRASAQPPTRKEVEEAQEDLWLLTALLEPIAEVNKDATAQLDAAVRQISVLELRGGGGTPAASATPTGGGGGADADRPINLPRVAAGRQSEAGVSFNPDDEFGTEVPSDDAGAAKPAGGNPDADIPTGRYGAAGGRSIKMGRYVDDKAAEWKTRGFYMELVMDHRKVPDLLVALANSEWPIRVTRVHQSDFLEEVLVSEQPVASNRPSAAPRRPVRAAVPSNADDEDRPVLFGGLRPGARGGMSLPRTSPTPRTTGGPAVPGQPSGSAFDDHNLANVAIDGLITIFKKPPEEPAAATQESAPASGAQGAPAAATENQSDADSESMPAEAADEAKSDSGDVPAADEPADEGDKSGADPPAGDDAPEPDKTPDGS